MGKNNGAPKNFNEEERHAIRCFSIGSLFVLGYQAVNEGIAYTERPEGVPALCEGANHTLENCSGNAGRIKRRCLACVRFSLVLLRSVGYKIEKTFSIPNVFADAAFRLTALVGRYIRKYFALKQRNI
jgi:hypothetical protein